jgi:hypothetical protein
MKKSGRENNRVATRERYSYANCFRDRFLTLTYKYASLTSIDISNVSSVKPSPSLLDASRKTMTIHETFSIRIYSRQPNTSRQAFVISIYICIWGTGDVLRDVTFRNYCLVKLTREITYIRQFRIRSSNRRRWGICTFLR